MISLLFAHYFPIELAHVAQYYTLFSYALDMHRC